MLRYSLMVATGLVSIILGLIIFFVLEAVTRQKILEAIVIDSPQHKNFQDWTTNDRSTAQAVYYKFYAFNLTNPDVFVAGGRPNFQQLGPFVYRMYQQKQNIVFFDDGNQVRFQVSTIYVFEPSLSIDAVSGSQLSDTTLIFNVNPYYIAAAYQFGSDAALSAYVAKSTDPAVIAATRQQLNRAIGGTAYGLFFRQLSVRQSIFGPDPLVAAMHSTAMPFVSNTSSTNEYSMYTGKRSASQAGMDFYTEYDGVEINTAYLVNYTVADTGRTASMAPFQGATPDTIQLWYSQNEVPVTLTFDGVEDIQGIETARYILDVNGVTAVNPTLYRTIQGFSTLAPFTGAPLFLSLPHFGNADPKMIAAVSGMNYNSDLHGTFIDLEPITGAPLAFAARAQLNIFVNFSAAPFYDLPQVNNRSMMIPLFWLDKSLELDKQGGDSLKSSVIRAVVARRAILGSLVGLGVVCVLIGAALMVQKGGSDTNNAEQPNAGQTKTEAAPDTEIPNSDDTDLQPFVPPPPPPQDDLEMENIGPRG